MKFLLIIALFIIGCSSMKIIPDQEYGIVIDGGTLQCLDMVTHVRAYGDICAESSSGYEDMSGKEAHFEGAMCMADSVRRCVNLSIFPRNE